MEGKANKRAFEMSELFSALISISNDLTEADVDCTSSRKNFARFFLYLCESVLRKDLPKAVQKNVALTLAFQM